MHNQHICCDVIDRICFPPDPAGWSQQRWRNQLLALIIAIIVSHESCIEGADGFAEMKVDGGSDVLNGAQFRHTIECLAENMATMQIRFEPNASRSSFLGSQYTVQSMIQAVKIATVFFF